MTRTGRTVTKAELDAALKQIDAAKASVAQMIQEFGAMQQTLTQTSTAVAETKQVQEQYKIAKYTGKGAEAKAEVGSVVWEETYDNTSTGIIKIDFPPIVGFTRITNIHLTVGTEGEFTTLNSPTARYEKVTLKGCQVRVIRPKPIHIANINDLAMGKTFDPVEPCTDTKVKVNIRIAGTRTAS